MGSLVLLKVQPPVFDPDATRKMGEAFDQAWHSMDEARANRLAPETSREILALAIIEMAQCGERDVCKLRDWSVNRLKEAQSLVEPERLSAPVGKPLTCERSFLLGSDA